MKAISSYFIRMLLIGLLSFTTVPIMSEEETIYLPLAGYDYLSLESQKIKT